MKVYVRSKKRKLSRLAHRCLWTFSLCWILAAFFEFLPLPINLYAFLISLSAIPFGLLMLSVFVWLFRKPFLIVEPAESFVLRLNSKKTYESIRSKNDLERTGNYLYSSVHDVISTEISRKNAIKLIQIYPEIRGEVIPEMVPFPQTTRGKWLVSIGKGFLSIVLFIVLLFGFEVYPYFMNIMMPWNRGKAVELTEEWGGLAHLPANRWMMDIQTEGGMFTRTFMISFKSSPSKVKSWVEESQGIRNVVPTYEDSHYVYRSLGYEKSIGGIVIIDYETGRVYIEMSWS